MFLSRKIQKIQITEKLWSSLKLMHGSNALPMEISAGFWQTDSKFMWNSKVPCPARHQGFKEVIVIIKT